MDNLSICKRIAEIEGIEFIHSKTFDIQRIAIKKDYYSGKIYESSDRNVAIEREYFKYNTYNPLTDDALCFQLIDMYAVNIKFCGGNILARCSGSASDWVKGLGLKRTCLLAIIEAHKD